MDAQTLPSADEQIVTRLQNAVRGVLLELESQGTAMDSVSGSYTVVIVDGEISVSKAEEAGSRRKVAPVVTSE